MPRGKADALAAGDPVDDPYRTWLLWLARASCRSPSALGWRNVTSRLGLSFPDRRISVAQVDLRNRSGVFQQTQRFNR